MIIKDIKKDTIERWNDYCQNNNLWYKEIHDKHNLNDMYQCLYGVPENEIKEYKRILNNTDKRYFIITEKTFQPINIWNIIELDKI